MQSSVLIALIWGAVSAISLPLGAWAGIRWRPHAKVVSTLMAFGAGALLFALSVELLGHVPELVDDIGVSALVAGVGGALCGGVIFDFLNQMLNNRGAFLRNLSNAKEYVAQSKRRRARRVLHRLAQLEAFSEVPPEELADLSKRVKRKTVAAGQRIFTPGEAADEIYFVRRGRIRLYEPEGGNSDVSTVQAFDSFGELGVLTNMPRTTVAEADGDTVLYVLEKDDLRDAAVSSHALRNALEQLVAERASQWRYRAAAPELEFLRKEAEDDLDEMHMPLEEQDFKSERDDMKVAKGVGMAIWLGIAIDAVPESLVIGSLAAGPEGMSVAFIVGVFLANFPEAMSSSVSMRIAGFHKTQILLMWGSLCLLTAVGAAIGAVVFASAVHTGPGVAVLFIEGLAAGAMLTAIAETMLPEAFEQGGSIVGIATLSGFLAALIVASL
ncbi:hypothetical protein BH24PSE2_BH24PSE2_20030 [soil metagenome]